MDAVDDSIGCLPIAHASEDVHFMTTALQGRGQFCYMDRYTTDGNRMQAFPCKHRNSHGH
jgi:hypothetical protein